MEKACANCGTEIRTPYCPTCGQDAHVGRLDLHSMLHELWHGFTHTDKGVLKLLRDLAVAPGRVYEAYFKGARKTYFSPVVFFLLSFGIFIYLDQKVFDYEDYIVKEYNSFGRTYHLLLKYIALAVLPIQALLTWAFFFRKRNLAECIVFWLYLVGFINVLFILVTPIRLWLIEDKRRVEFYMEMLSLLIMTWHAWKVFGTSKTNKFLVLLLIFLLQVIIVYITMFFLIHHDLPLEYPNLWQAIKEAFWIK